MDLPELYRLFDVEADQTVLPQFNLDFTFANTTALPDAIGLPFEAGGIPSASPTTHIPGTALVPASHDQADWALADQARGAGIPKQRQRRFAPRSRHGCLTCRARRKRCDAQRPVCRACIRVNVECEWPSKGRASDYHRRDLDTEANHYQHGCDEQQQQQQPARPEAAARGSFITSDYMAASLPSSLSSSSSSTATVPQAPGYSTLPNRFNRKLSAEDAALERHLLTYYVHSFIPRVTIAKSSSNVFTSLYIPMSFQHSGVLDAIIACAAAHLAKSTQSFHKSQELHQVVVQRQRLALDYVKSQVENPSMAGGVGEQGDYKLEVVVVLLLLVGLETQTGGRGLRWMQQIQWVRQLLQRQAASVTDVWSSWEVNCVLNHFVYHDVMCLIMEDVLDPETRSGLSDDSTCTLADSPPLAMPPLPPPLPMDTVHYSQGCFGASSCDPASPVVPGIGNTNMDIDCLLGLSTDLFKLIMRQRDLREARYWLPGADDSHFWELETEISNWQYNNDLAASLDVNTRLDLIALAECHRLTALILLYRQHTGRSYYLPDLASQIMSIIPRISPDSPVAPALTPILFLAGAELTSEVDIALCASRLRSIKDGIKMMNIAPAEEVLRHVWNDRLQNKISTDWLKVMRARHWTINLG
ncbi:hypothetical protein THAR02_01711 [Trichoderma harzianum]|uniref:Zn(2)-C6 fungal-type domain-containing protein n=1 Tax=Trichoderma harzianum TaxID=5544 RepID=A0A0F9Y218_TRIHA|nr:hypothetical protein THAR02_01711 [Trichoderma harzianum]